MTGGRGERLEEGSKNKGLRAFWVFGKKIEKKTTGKSQILPDVLI